MLAKILYAIILDRMSLSFKNKWIDADNHVYVIITLEEICSIMGCGKDKACELLAELDSKVISKKNKTIKGIGLIERKKRGLGKPDLIYPKKYTDFLEIPSEVQASENPKSRVLNNSTPEFVNSEPNKTEINDTEISDTSIYPSISDNEVDGRIESPTQEDMYEAYEQIIRTNVDCELFAHELDLLDQRAEQEDMSNEEYDIEFAAINPDTMNQIIHYMTDIVSGHSSKPIMIYDTPVPRSVVASKLLKVNHFQMRNCIHTLNTQHNIHNRRNYAISVLYNS